MSTFNTSTFNNDANIDIARQGIRFVQGQLDKRGIDAVLSDMRARGEKV